jgi:hypothetical protein
MPGEERDGELVVWRERLLAGRLWRSEMGVVSNPGGELAWAARVGEPSTRTTELCAS